MIALRSAIRPFTKFAASRPLAPRSRLLSVTRASQQGQGQGDDSVGIQRQGGQQNMSESLARSSDPYATAFPSFRWVIPSR